MPAAAFDDVPQAVDAAGAEAAAEGVERQLAGCGATLLLYGCFN
jgi:hypothetical protein